MGRQPRLTRKRAPKLSEQPETPGGRYYATYTQDGKNLRQRFTRNREESTHLYNLWLAKRYGLEIEIVSSPAQPSKHIAGASLMAIGTAYIERQKRRVRGYDDDHRRGTINQQTCDDIEHQVNTIVEWAKDNLGVRFRSIDMDGLFAPTSYEDMFIEFTKRWGPSFVGKLRQRFWNVVRFAAREPWRVRLSFRRDEVMLYGGDDGRQERHALPTVSDLKKILKVATLRERTWIWLGLGCAFGPQDIARCKTIHFDKHAFDLRRGKTGVDRYGPMFPRVWQYLQLYVAEHPIKTSDLLFKTENGNPIAWVGPKKPDAKPGVVSYSKSSALRMAWLRLLKRAGVEWAGGFYMLRHLGGTSFGSRPDVSVVALRDFMGHASIETTNRYLRA